MAARRATHGTIAVAPAAVDAGERVISTPPAS